MNGQIPPPFDVFVDEPEFKERWFSVIGDMLAQLDAADRTEFDRICRDEPGTMKCWPWGDYFQLTIGKDDQLVLGTVNRGVFHTATTPGTLN